MTHHERIQLLVLMGVGLLILFVICQVEMRYRRKVRDDRRAIQRKAFDRKMGRTS